MTIAEYAVQVLNFLHDNGFEYAEPDAKGGTFPGGILMDLGGGQRVAFILPNDSPIVARQNLAGYVEEVYPQGHTLGMDEYDAAGVWMIRVRLDVAELAHAG